MLHAGRRTDDATASGDGAIGAGSWPTLLNIGFVAPVNASDETIGAPRPFAPLSIYLRIAAESSKCVNNGPDTWNICPANALGKRTRG